MIFIETNGRMDTLIKMFAYYPEKAIRYVIRRRGKIISRFLIIEGGSSTVKNL